MSSLLQRTFAIWKSQRFKTVSLAMRLYLSCFLIFRNCVRIVGRVLTWIGKVNFEKCTGISNAIFGYINLYLPGLQDLTLGGTYLKYNQVFSYKGLSLLLDSNIALKRICFSYCSKIGTKSLEVVANSFSRTLEELVVLRNCLDQCTQINDESLLVLSKCQKIKRLTINYCREFGDDALDIIAVSFPNLEYLNIKDCILQCTFHSINRCCPNLREINISGDS